MVNNPYSFSLFIWYQRRVSFLEYIDPMPVLSVKTPGIILGVLISPINWGKQISFKLWPTLSKLMQLKSSETMSPGNPGLHWNTCPCMWMKRKQRAKTFLPRSISFSSFTLRLLTCWLSSVVNCCWKCAHLTKAFLYSLYRLLKRDWFSFPQMWEKKTTKSLPGTAVPWVVFMAAAFQ